jgi:hypothetical protein
MLEMNAAGMPLAICSEVPQSMLRTDAGGMFRMLGPPVGGHCYQFLDHDRNKDVAWIGQSWAHWGERSDDPSYANRGGFTQIGTCPLSDLALWFTPAQMSSGSAEAICYNTVEGFDQVIPTVKPVPVEPAPPKPVPVEPEPPKPSPPKPTPIPVPRPKPNPRPYK